jgi:hypothetical protein
MPGTPARTGSPQLVNIRSSARAPATAALHPTLEQHGGQPARPTSATARKDLIRYFGATLFKLDMSKLDEHLRAVSSTRMLSMETSTRWFRIVRNCVSTRVLARYGPISPPYDCEPVPKPFVTTRDLPEFGNANHNCLGPKGCKTGSMLHTFKLARLRFTALSRHAAHFA